MKASWVAACAAVFALAGCVSDEELARQDAERGSFERATGVRVDDPDAANRGTLQGVTGQDPGTANLVRCSDGKLYQDCANSPAGF